jgi:hypothetical protein
MTTEARPLTYLCVLSTTPANIMPVNPSRKGLIFFNPSNNTVAVAPAFGTTFTGGAFNIPMGTIGPVLGVMVVGGVGTISILPGGMLSIPQAGWPEVGMGAAWNAVASGPNTYFTVWEF